MSRLVAIYRTLSNLVMTVAASTPSVSVPVAGVDTLFCVLDSDVCPMNIAGLFQLNAIPPRDYVMSRMTAVLKFDRFKQLLVEAPSLSNRVATVTYEWRFDPLFQPSNHITYHEIAESVGHDKDGMPPWPLLSSLVSDICSRKFNRNHPLWNVTIITQKNNKRFTWGVISIHHAITDGLGAVQLMLSIFDQHPPSQQPSSSTKQKKN